jgi:D-serine dehydratase
VSSPKTGCQSHQKIGLNLLDETIEFPQAVLSQSVIAQNAKWMASFAAEANVALAPHAKTTMAPELFKLQLENGAWGLSVATVKQLEVAVSAGAKHILLANQLVGKQHYFRVATILKHRQVELFCFVDNSENLAELSAYFSALDLTLNVLIECGVTGGRAGCRSEQDIVTLAKQAKQSAGIALCGIAFYEGVIHSQNTEQTILAFAQNIADLTCTLAQQKLFEREKIIVTGAGSAWYDLVCDGLNTLSDHPDFEVVIRPGCYLVQDTGIYQTAHQNLLARSKIACSIDGELASGLSLWAYISSTPEPGMAILAFGKRDVAFDAGLPTPERLYSRANKQLNSLDSDWNISKIMDHHAMLTYPENQQLKVGDLIEVSTSHPCLTFDKWREILLVDDQLTIVDQLDTYF